MTVSQVIATQASNTVTEVVWVSDTSPTLGFEVFRDVNAGGVKSLGTVGDVSRAFIDDTISALIVGDSVVYSIEDLDTTLVVAAPAIILRDLDVPFTYGAVSFLNTTPRYTTLDAVKKALSINDTVNDTDITQAIVAAETQIDQFNARSFPDTGSNPQIPGIPNPISVWALSASIGVYKLRDTVYGSAGADDWIGAIDVGEQVRRALVRNPLALGFRVAWGLS